MRRYKLNTAKVIAFDIDDTLVSRPSELSHLGKFKYLHCTPLQDNINICNSLYDAGHTIILYTARGMTSFNGDVMRVYAELYDMTEKQMNEFGIKFHKLVLGKINYNLLIDDKAINTDELSYQNLRNYDIHLKIDKTDE